MSDDGPSGRGYWPWFMAAAAIFGAIPWLAVGIEWPVVIGFVCGAISAKWFVFAAFDLRDGRTPNEGGGMGGARPVSDDAPSNQTAGVEMDFVRALGSRIQWKCPDCGHRTTTAKSVTAYCKNCEDGGGDDR